MWEEMVNSGRINPSDFVRITSTAAAQIFNIYPRKVGRDQGLEYADAKARCTRVSLS